MKTKKNLFTHLNIQMAAFFLAANFIFLLICSALYYQWAFQILLENSEKLHIQSMQQTQHRIEQTLDEADRAVNLLSYGIPGKKSWLTPAAKLILTASFSSVIIWNRSAASCAAILPFIPFIFTPATIC